MPPDVETAYAKINLALHVRRRRDDGYHDIETLFAFAQHGDQLQASLSDTLGLTIDGPFASGLSADDDNLVMQAAIRLRAHFSITSGASIRLTKNLPIASGIGGGSADAAAAARLLNRLWDIQASEQELADILAPLGADIPACVFSRTSFGSGTGTALELRPTFGIGILTVFMRVEGRVIGVIANDIGGLFVGASVGKTPLREWVSPNKTIEGAIGGAIATLVALVVVGSQNRTWNSMGEWIALAIVISVMAPIGDLVESMFKRNLDVKDFGTLIKGHGGVLDRFDGFLFALPAVYYLMLVIEPWTAL